MTETVLAGVTRGDFVKVPCRYSESMRYLIPEIRGIVRRVNVSRGTIDVIEFKTHSTRTGKLDGTVLMRGRSKAVEKHITEVKDIPTFRSPGNRIPTEIVKETSLGELVVQRYLTKLRSRRKEQMAAKKNGKNEAVPKKARRGKVTLAGVQADEFFTENAKGKSVFRPGWDAKFAGAVKRLANGTADADDKRICKAKTILNHPKVAESAHFQHLLKEAAKASA